MKNLASTGEDQECLMKDLQHGDVLRGKKYKYIHCVVCVVYVVCVYVCVCVCVTNLTIHLVGIKSLFVL